MSKELTSIRIGKDTVSDLKAINIQIGGVDLLSHDDKIKHLMWFYTHYKNNNGK